MGINRNRQILPAQVLRIGVGCFIPVLALALSGCDGSNNSSQQTTEDTVPADTLVEYTVRGRVTQLPGGPEHPAREFMVRHEAIPEYRRSLSPDDDRMGMMSMAMAFPLGEGVSVEGIQVGYVIEMMFETSYDQESGRLKGYVVRRLTPLSPETVLDIKEH